MVRNAQALAEDTDVQECETSKEVGLLFYEERSRRQLSIKDVSQELHIRQLYISCIEEGK
jgi:ribosome-binding protein aMBF1 (putative translation factor)